jgi:hypothetical protein
VLAGQHELEVLMKIFALLDSSFTTCIQDEHLLSALHYTQLLEVVDLSLCKKLTDRVVSCTNTTHPNTPLGLELCVHHVW